MIKAAALTRFAGLCGAWARLVGRHFLAALRRRAGRPQLKRGPSGGQVTSQF